MRTNIDIDDDLMKEAMRATGQKTKKGAVEESLRQAIERGERRRALQELRGMGWAGDLEEMRNEGIRGADWGFQEAK